MGSMAGLNAAVPDMLAKHGVEVATDWGDACPHAGGPQSVTPSDDDVDDADFGIGDSCGWGSSPDGSFICLDDQPVDWPALAPVPETTAVGLAKRLLAMAPTQSAKARPGKVERDRTVGESFSRSKTVDIHQGAEDSDAHSKAC